MLFGWVTQVALSSGIWNSPRCGWGFSADTIFPRPFSGDPAAAGAAQATEAPRQAPTEAPRQEQLETSNERAWTAPRVFLSLFPAC